MLSANQIILAIPPEQFGEITGLLACCYKFMKIEFIKICLLGMVKNGRCHMILKLAVLQNGVMD